MIKSRNSERRSVPRTKGIYFVRYRKFSATERKLDIHEWDGMTLDLSEIGTTLVTEKKIPIGTNVLIRFSLNNEIGPTLGSQRKIVVFTGMTIYCDNLEDGLYRQGIYFGPINKENQDKFFDIICSLTPSWMVSGAASMGTDALNIEEQEADQNTEVES